MLVCLRGKMQQKHDKRITIQMNDALRATNFSSTCQKVNNLYKNFKFLKLLYGYMQT